jgi:hypothetical protein
MIAVFNKSVETVTDHAKKLWNVYRKTIIMEYHAKPLLPIPFSILQFLIYDVPCYIKGRFEKYIPCHLTTLFGKSNDIESLKFDCTVLNIKARDKPPGSKAMDWIKFTSNWEQSIHNKMMVAVQNEQVNSITESNKESLCKIQEENILQTSILKCEMKALLCNKTGEVEKQNNIKSNEEEDQDVTSPCGLNVVER